MCQKYFKQPGGVQAAKQTKVYEGGLDPVLVFGACYVSTTVCSGRI